MAENKTHPGNTKRYVHKWALGAQTWLAGTRGGTCTLGTGLTVFFKVKHTSALGPEISLQQEWE